MKTRIVISLCLSAGLGFTSISFANHCPSKLHQDSKGYWTSNDEPGWKSVKPTASHVTLEPNNFGGAIYSPKQRRMACVYKSSEGKWIALVSNINHPFNQDDLNMEVWTHAKKQNIYICGTPKYKLKDCTFEVKN